MLEGLIRSKVNILISGGTGAGKTTLLNMLSGYIPATGARRDDRGRGRAAVAAAACGAHGNAADEHRRRRRGHAARDLVRNALRMRPDRIIIGECRGAEAFDMLQAMNTGHEGSLTTIHANNPRDALARLEIMVGMAGFNLPHQAVRQQIASAINGGDPGGRG